VCAVLSLLVQVTAVPFLTVIEAGVKAKFSIVTLLLVLGAEVAVGVALSVGIGMSVIVLVAVLGFFVLS